MKSLKLAACAAMSALVAAAAQAQVPDAAAKAPALKLMAATFSITDPDRALAFYTNGLGLTAAPRNDMPTVTEYPVRFPGGDAYLLLLARKGAGASAPRPAGNGVILSVPDVKALKARLEAAGYALLGPLIEVKAFNVLVGHVADPDGNKLELVQGAP